MAGNDGNGNNNGNGNIGNGNGSHNGNGNIGFGNGSFNGNGNHGALATGSFNGNGDSATATAVIPCQAVEPERSRARAGSATTATISPKTWAVLIGDVGPWKTNSF
jgi:hypothetical protein